MLHFWTWTWTWTFPKRQRMQCCLCGQRSCGHASFCCAARAEHTAWMVRTRGSSGPPTSWSGTRTRLVRSVGVCKTVRGSFGQERTGNADSGCNNLYNSCRGTKGGGEGHASGLGVGAGIVGAIAVGGTLVGQLVGADIDLSSSSTQAMLLACEKTSSTEEVFSRSSSGTSLRR